MLPIIPPNTLDFKKSIGTSLDEIITKIIINSRGFG
jgi:hypothetical protein